MATPARRGAARLPAYGDVELGSAPDVPPTVSVTVDVVVSVTVDVAVCVTVSGGRVIVDAGKVTGSGNVVIAAGMTVPP
jgi:hypothetical protein